MKTIKHLRFMLMLLLATLGVNVAFGAETFTFSWTTAGTQGYSYKQAGPTSGTLLTNNAVYFASSESPAPKVDAGKLNPYRVGFVFKPAYDVTMKIKGSAGSSARSINISVDDLLDSRLFDLYVNTVGQSKTLMQYALDNASADEKTFWISAGVLKNATTVSDAKAVVGYTANANQYSSRKSATALSIAKNGEAEADVTVDDASFVFKAGKCYRVYLAASSSTGSQLVSFTFTQVISGPVDPTITFSDANYEIGETLNLAGKFNSNSDGAVTYTVKDAGTTGATISGSNFTATAAGTAVVTASQAATASYNAMTLDATITVTAASVKSAIVYANTKGASTAGLPTQYSEGVGIASFDALEDVAGFHFTGWNPSSISASATGEQTITAEWTKAPRTMFSIVMKDGISKSLAKGGGEQALDATYATVTGGAALVKNIDASNDGKMQLTNNGIYFNGGNAYLYIALDEELHEGDVITFTSNSTNQICFTLDDTRETSLTTADKSYTIPAESPLIGAAELYVWRTSSSGTNVKTLTIKTIEDYVAPVYHSVTFDMQGATSAAIEAQSVKNGKKAVKPEDPTKTGFDFVKWVVASTEADYDFNTAVTADVALKAVWEIVVPTESSEKQLTRVNFSNGFDAFINETDHTVTAYYLAGQTAPTLSVENLQVSAAASAAIDGSTITVTAEDFSTQDYIITLETVTPAAIGEYIFTDVPSWVKAPYGYAADKGVKFSKNADDGRIQLGNTRQYYFVEACEKLELTWKTSVRPVKVYRNGTEVSASTVDGKLTIPCDVDNACMIAVVSNQTSGDGGFSAARVAAYEVTCPSSVAITGSKTYTDGATITLTAAQTGGNGTITYQWYKDDVAIVGATSATFEKVSTMEDGGNYVCKVNQTDCEEVASEAYAVVVNKNPVSSVAVASEGDVVRIKKGESINLTATVTPADATYPEVTWSSEGTPAYFTFADVNANPAVAVANKVGTSKKVYAKADGKTGQILLTCYTVVTYNVNGGDAIVDAEYDGGTAITLPTPTGGTEPFLGWYTDAEFTNKAGNAGASYKPADNVTLYAKWTMPDAETPTITTQPVGATYDEGAPMTALTVVASVSEGTLSYQWYKGSSVIEGATAAEFTPTEAGTYKVVVTNTLAGHNPASATSDNAVITVNRAAVEQSDVTVSTTWNWANAGSSVDKGDGVSASGVLANEDGITNDVTFNSQALVYAGRYPNRGGYFQGGSISFHTTIAGMVAVQFSNTGGNAARTARINGSYDAEIASTGGSAKATFTSFVEAGDVVIEGIQVSDEATKDIRIYSITFTAATQIRSGLTAGDFGTMCQAKPIAALGGAIVYEIEKKNAIGLDLVEAEFPLVAGKPYFYQATAAEVSVIYGEGDAATKVVEANGLVGRLSTAPEPGDEDVVPEGMYVIQKNNLRKVTTSNIKFLADHAYINYDAVEDNAVEDDPQAAPRRRVTMGGVSADVVTSIDEISAETGATKFIENGILYIRRAGKIYSAQGQLVK